jgi:hypothetical protein
MYGSGLVFAFIELLQRLNSSKHYALTVLLTRSSLCQGESVFRLCNFDIVGFSTFILLH